MHPFYMFLFNKNAKLSFSFDQSSRIVQDINVAVEVSLADIFDDNEIIAKYFKKVISLYFFGFYILNLSLIAQSFRVIAMKTRCPFCGGTGAAAGFCRTCTLCEGRGESWHILKRGSHMQVR